MKFNNKKILIFQQRGWAISMGNYLAKKLQAEGCRLAAITLKNTTHEYILKQKEIKYDLIINDDEIMNDPKKYLAGDYFSFKDICADLGIDSLWPIISSLRNYVKSYKDKFYYSFRQNKSDEEIAYYVMAAYKCVKVVFKYFKPEVIIAPNFVNLIHIMFDLYARKHGAEMIAITDCKIKGVFIFSHNYQDSEGPFYKRVDELNNGAESLNRDKAKKYIQEFRESFKTQDCLDRASKKKSLPDMIRHKFSPYYHILSWYLNKQVNYLKNLGVTVDYRPPRIILRDYFGYEVYRKFMENFSFYAFDKIGKFVYFPLQFQPEAPIDVAAPYFSNQIETARLIAMSLPDDYILVVKEHPNMVGLRPPSYIEKIARTPNVKLVDYRISSGEILKKADLIVSPNSTTLVEAAFYSKPAIQLGDLGTTLKLPNVFRHTDMTTLSKKIKEILNINLKTEAYEKKLENYVSAVYDVGFKMNYGKIWTGDERADMEYVWQIYRKEIEEIFIKQTVAEK